MIEPDEAYEIYTRNQDAAYERFTVGKTHETCSQADPTDERITDEDYTYCDKYDMCVSRYEYVQGVCDCYTED
jgi:hypothetical protein